MDAWETSGYLDKADYPLGWRDALDDDGHIWAAELDGAIIASCRVNIFKRASQIEYSRVSDLLRFCDAGGLRLNYPLAYNSRMVVSPSFRRLGVSLTLDEFRMRFIRGANAKMIIATTDLCWRRDSLVARGWCYLGDINPEFDPDSKIGVSHVVTMKMPYES